MGDKVSLDSPNAARTCAYLETFLVRKRGLVEGGETHSTISNGGDLGITDLASGGGHGRRG